MLFFKNKNNKKLKDDPGNILYYGIYHPYRNRLNPKFDFFSSKILALKKLDQKAIDYFFNLLDPILGEGFTIVVIPPHDPNKKVTGIKKLAQKLCERPGRIDGTDCLIRIKKVKKKAHGGQRDFNAEFYSMVVKNKELIRGKAVLLLDDVTTTGISLKAGKKLLEKAGAKVIQAFALAKTSKDF